MCLKANEEQTSLSLLQPVGGEFLLRSSGWGKKAAFHHEVATLWVNLTSFSQQHEEMQNTFKTKMNTDVQQWCRNKSNREVYCSVLLLCWMSVASVPATNRSCIHWIAFLYSQQQERMQALLEPQRTRPEGRTTKIIKIMGLRAILSLKPEFSMSWWRLWSCSHQTRLFRNRGFVVW